MPDPDLQSQLIMPQVIGLVVTNFHKVNVCPVNWQIVSTKYETPMTVCIGLSLGHYTLKAIQETGEFTYAYPTKNQLKDSLYCGTVSGNQVDKIHNTSFEFLPAQTISPPLIKDAALNLECKLHSQIKMDNYTIIIGEVTQIHESNHSPLDKVYSLGGQKYGIIKETQVLQDRRVK